MSPVHETVAPAGPLGYGPGAYDEIVRQTEPEVIVHVAALGLSETGGIEFLEAVARDVAASAGVCASYVGVLEDPEGTRARTVARFRDGDRRDDYVFEVADTPAATVVARNICTYTGVRDGFPRDSIAADAEADWFLGVPLLDQTGAVIGLLAAMGRGLPIGADQVLETMLLLAGRASLELERILADRLADTERHMLENLLVRRTAELGALRGARPAH